MSRGGLCEGRVEYAHTPYQTCQAGEIELLAPEFAHPQRVKLAVELREGSRTFANSWNLWLFPRDMAIRLPIWIYRQPTHTWLKDFASPGAALVHEVPSMDRYHVLLAEGIDGALVEYMQEGGRVILAASEGLVRPTTPSWPPMWNTARYFFTPPANYPTYEDRVNGTIIQSHPALGDLPHEGFADLLFFRMIGNSAPIDIGALGLTGDDPLIRCIHQYLIGRPLAYLVECALGKGGLMLCSLDLNQTWPEARYLLSQLCTYVAGDQFKPITGITEETLVRLLQAGSI